MQRHAWTLDMDDNSWTYTTHLYIIHTYYTCISVTRLLAPAALPFNATLCICFVLLALQRPAEFGLRFHRCHAHYHCVVNCEILPSIMAIVRVNANLIAFAFSFAQSPGFSVFLMHVIMMQVFNRYWWKSEHSFVCLFFVLLLCLFLR